MKFAGNLVDKIDNEIEFLVLSYRRIVRAINSFHIVESKAGLAGCYAHANVEGVTPKKAIKTHRRLVGFDELLIVSNTDVGMSSI